MVLFHSYFYVYCSLTCLSKTQRAKLYVVSDLHYTSGITPKRVTRGELQLRGLAPGQHYSEETSQRRRRCVRFDCPGFKPPTFPTNSVCLTTQLPDRLPCNSQNPITARSNASNYSPSQTCLPIIRR